MTRSDVVGRGTATIQLNGIPSHPYSVHCGDTVPHLTFLLDLWCGKFSRAALLWTGDPSSTEDAVRNT